ncbi:MAG TPA: L-threonylcarbamoyladenylate synthase [Thermoanaerobaculaceae bacterium]|nr:L-threonylcarbamoyladenylate synthase [Thermoanaerobaculaceae bacterium]HPS78140.1 L-threonylcarbamoyladenylate synthase [Thermoanaerobaculaceae bacterium]
MQRLRFGEIQDVGAAELACRDLLAAHGIVALPTETFYGLAVSPDDPAAVEALLTLKGRSAEKSLPLVAANLRQVEVLVELPPVWRARLVRVWPAPLTVVLPVRRALAACGRTAAVRVPAHPLLRTLLEALGPLTATSANRTGTPALAEPDAVARTLGDGLGLLLDGGVTPGGLPSTLLDLTYDRPKILRAGAFRPPSSWAVTGV